MKRVLIDLTAEPPAAPIEFDAVTIGVFDGLHRGHRAIVDRMRDAGPRIGLVTFSVHPRSILSGRAPVRLLGQSMRDAILRDWDVGFAVEIETHRELLSLSAEVFLDRFFLFLRPSVIVVGENFRFGKGREGTIEMLRSDGRARVEIIDPLKSGDRSISATWVREALAEGKLREAKELLGRPYAVSAFQQKGDGIGRDLGSPTVNLEPPPEALPDGVYAVEARPGGRGVAHLGARPTMGADERRFEVHLFDPPPDDAGPEWTIAFHERLRDVRKFAGREELAAAIAEDVERAKALV